jgi:hypothetical protein
MSGPPRTTQVRKWRELGPEGRLELGASLVTLGQRLNASTVEED